MRLIAVGVGCWCLLVGGCTRADRPRAPSNERARDSAIGASNLPGAQGVRGALRATDSATARRSVEDSIARAGEP